MSCILVFSRCQTLNVIQQINIADYKNIFLIVDSGLSMDHRKIENFLVSEQKVVFDRSWKLNLLSAHSEFLIWLTIRRRTKYAIMKKIEGDAIFSRSF